MIVVWVEVVLAVQIAMPWAPLICIRCDQLRGWYTVEGVKAPATQPVRPLCSAYLGT
jgi:hypothetical protein